MTAHELARQLLDNPDFPVTISFDLDEEDNSDGKRAFSTDIWHVEKNQKEVMIMADGVTNFKYKRNDKLRKNRKGH